MATQTAFQTDSFQNNAFQIGVSVVSTDSGHGDSRFLRWSDAFRKRIEEEEEEAVAVMLMNLMG